jgi:hypothetical protein
MKLVRISAAPVEAIIIMDESFQSWVCEMMKAENIYILLLFIFSFHCRLNMLLHFSDSCLYKDIEPKRGEIYAN